MATLKAERRVRSAELQRIVLISISFGMFLAWVGAIHYSHVIGFSHMGSTPFASATSLVNALVFAVAFMIYAKGGRVQHSRSLQIMVCIVALFGTFSLRYDYMYFFIPLAVGFSVAWFRLAYAEHFGNFGGKRTLFTFGNAFIVCGLVYLGLTRLSASGMFALMLALPIVFTVLLYTATAHQAGSNQAAQASKRHFNTSIQYFWKLAVMVFAFSFLFDLTEMFLIVGRETSFAWSYAMGFVLSGAVVVMLGVLYPKATGAGERFLIAAMIASTLFGILAFYLSPVVDSEAITLIIQTVGGYGFVAIFQAAAAHTVKEKNMQPGYVFAAVLCLQRFGNSLGEFASTAIISSPLSQTAIYIIISLIIVLIFVVVIMVLLEKENPSYIAQINGALRGSASLSTTNQAAQKKAADKNGGNLDPVTQQGVDHGLTAREVEVLQLLSKDKSASDICKDLHISVSTVKTHMQHIYQKFGVSGKQELLEVLHPFTHDSFEGESDA